MTLLPTGKNHVSFSELKNWKECTFRHKLLYIDKLGEYENNPYADFGTVLHESIEDYFKSKSIDFKKVETKIINLWAEHGYDSEEFIESMKEQRHSQGLKYTHENLSKWLKSAERILTEFPTFIDENFPGWELISVEEKLMENIPNDTAEFKGFIDCVLKVPKGKDGNKFNYWVLDWKTTGASGWYYLKRREFLSLCQIGLYKNFWSKKHNIDIKDIRTGFVFLRRNNGKTPIEFFKVSTGPVFLEKANKLINHMLINIRKQFSIKNYNSCKFCQFNNSEHCRGER